MTAMPEAKLAREAELCYATVALATDYDCWREGHDAVTVAQVVETMMKNVAVAREVIRLAAGSVAQLDPRDCPCAHALDHAIMTAKQSILPSTRSRLALLLGDRPQ